MAKKKSRKEELFENLKADYNRWHDLFTNGGSDPFWSDGCNLELVKNHIIYDKRQIEEELQPEDYPEEYFDELPPDVPKDYMAKAEEITQKAPECLRRVKEDPAYIWLAENRENPEISKLVQKQVQNFLAYVDGCEDAIKNNRLVDMRRFCKNFTLDQDAGRLRKNVEEDIHERKQRGLPQGQSSLFDFI